MFFLVFVLKSHKSQHNFIALNSFDSNVALALVSMALYIFCLNQYLRRCIELCKTFHENEKRFE